MEKICAKAAISSRPLEEEKKKQQIRDEARTLYGDA
jgi:hypothetical protein